MGQMTPRVDLLSHTAKCGAAVAAAGSRVGQDLPFVLCAQGGGLQLDGVKQGGKIYIVLKHLEIRC